VSNGEYNPIPQTEDQAKVESLIKEMGDNQAKRHGMDHGSFLATSAGMATAFLAMNKVFGPIFDVSEDEAGDMEMSDYRASQLSNQFIFDDQTHFGRAVRLSSWWLLSNYTIQNACRAVNKMAGFMKSGYIPWSTDLARIPEKYGVNIVYGEIGSTFASSAVTNPRFCAAFFGQLVNIMGPERVVWGTDSVWYGSPQWQIEAMRRMEIPNDIMRKHKWKIPLGGPNSEAKQKIFGLNSAHLYNLDLRMSQEKPFRHDQIAQIKND
jgi:hypothetical protein